ncbi:prepilin peptidase [Ramlibacter ginsenosidimutans]|uniref:Prepilin leader peptidase/N-methyltransferase n=1 Tax=Ramlibacter ginsenosidimutans TaxID=502333 RepID=A0A934WMU5_9BURK|nr:A24 family peptidase [Ramlibacter ginsenosidimutans]MBK6006980.1 prepilin peptidase [Ramlibacter ginsenosidimutans]
MLLPASLEAAILAAIFGLLIGSFLNVVIYRFPKMLERQWAAECADFTGQPAKEEAEPVFNLVAPRSRCPHCGHQIRWYENIPVVSWLALRGRCSQCKARISVRYPVVEVVTAAFFFLCGERWGLGLQAAAWAAFAALLICLFLIDMDTQILPDDLNYTLLWLGLLASAAGWTVPLASAVWGAALGYGVFWLIFQLFKLATGKEGMGYGDFKLLAALGAWLGAPYLVAIILLSSIVGAAIGILLLFVGKLANKDIPMPFGPYLAGAGLLALALSPAAMPALLPFAFPFGAH